MHSIRVATIITFWNVNGHIIYKMLPLLCIIEKCNLKMYLTCAQSNFVHN